MDAYSGFTPTQKALYMLFTSDIPLMAMVTGVFDRVPERQPFPYIRIGSATETPDNAHGQFGRETVQSVDIWSDYRGFAEADLAANRVQALLDHKPLVVPGREHVSTRYEFGQTLSDPETELRHIVLRFRITTA